MPFLFLIKKQRLSFATYERRRIIVKNFKKDSILIKH